MNNELFISTIQNLNDAALFNVSGEAAVGLEIKGTWTGTLLFEYTIDGQVFHSLAAVTGETSTTGNGAFRFDVAAYKEIRVRFNPATSGNPQVYLFAKDKPMSSGTSGGGGGGTQYADGAAAATPTGNTVMWNEAGTERAVSAAKPLPVQQAALSSSNDSVTVPGIGATTDAAVVGDNNGSVTAKLRGLIKIFNDIWDSTNHLLGVRNLMDTGTIMNGATALTPKFAKIAASSSGNNALVAAVTSKKIRVLAYNFISNGTVNAKFQSDGAGTPADLTGLKYLLANIGMVAPFNPAGWFESASGKSLDINLSATIAIGGELVYVEI